MTPPGPTQSGSAGIDVLSYLRVPLTYRWWIVASVLVVSGAAVAWTVRQPRIYDAACTVEYDPTPPRPLGSGVEDVADPAGSFWMTREFFETQNRIIGSRNIAERVVRQFGLHQDPDFFGIPEQSRASWEGVSVEQAAQLLQSRLRVDPEERTRIVAIHIRDTQPDRAARLANAVAEAYIDKTIEDRLSSTVSALTWLSEQLDSLRSELSESEMALHEFNSTLSVSIEDRQKIVGAEIEQFDQALTETRTRRIELSARVARLRSLLRDRTIDEQAASLNDLETLTSLREQLHEKLTEREALALRYGPAHPRMAELDSQLAHVRQQLSVEVDAIVASAEADLTEAQATERGLRQALDEAQMAGLELNLREIEYERLNRERENNTKLYNLVLQRSTETDLTRMLRVTHVRMVDRALVPGSHVAPVLALNAGAGLMGGLLLGLLLSFGRHWMDRRVKSIEDVEALGLTVLGALPKLDTTAPGTKAARRRARPARELAAHVRPMSAFAESCRNLRTNLMFTAGESPLRTLVVTSSDPEEGKTTVAANLSVSIAQSGRRVLLIDTDLRRPRVHRAFGLSSSPGITSVIAGMTPLEKAIVHSQVAGLDILPSGPIPPNPAELLHHDAFARILDDAKRRYDLVVFDTPPILAVTDASALAPRVDAVVLVVKAQLTTKDAVRSAARQLSAVGARLAGCVVNHYDPRKDRYGYGSGYGSYASRYYSDEASDELPRDEAPAARTTETVSEKSLD